MNTKEEFEKDFLRLQKILRELRFLRYNNLSNKANRKRIEEAMRLLGPISDELKEKLERMQKPKDDYDI